MIPKEPLKEILRSTRQLWDQPGSRPTVRLNFEKVLNCRTEFLGSEIYASSTESKVIHHTCKSRACPSCGHRATTLWQRQQWAGLPDVMYAGVVLTMPDKLWPIFRTNRHLLDDLPALGAAVIERWSQEIQGVRRMIMVVRHTFGRHLTFNPHLHILTSAGGLRVADNRWIEELSLDRDALMSKWRYAVINYLRAALEQGLLCSELEPRQLREIFSTQYARWWNVNVQRCSSKEHFLRYAGRYVRRPPLAQYRLLPRSADKVGFRTKDHRLKREVETWYSPEDFIRNLSDHVSEHYQHAVRHFGLLAPRSKRTSFGAIFARLGQRRRAKPQRLSYAESVERAYGVNPLQDSNGEPMRLIARRPPRSQ